MYNSLSEKMFGQKDDGHSKGSTLLKLSLICISDKNLVPFTPYVFSVVDGTLSIVNFHFVTFLEFRIKTSMCQYHNPLKPQVTFHYIFFV